MTLTVGSVSCYILESQTLFHRQRERVCACVNCLARLHGCSSSIFIYLYYFGFCTRAIYIIVIHISSGPGHARPVIFNYKGNILYIDMSARSKRVSSSASQFSDLIVYIISRSHCRPPVYTRFKCHVD